MSLPSFLRRENTRKEPSEFRNVLKKYMEHFGTGPNTEDYSYSQEEWIKMMKKCIEEDYPIEDIVGY